MSGSVTVAYGGPNGFSTDRVVTIPGGGQCQRILLADFDGDGRADAVTANTESHSVSVLLSAAGIRFAKGGRESASLRKDGLSSSAP
jgi:hypothetical protein